MTEIWFTVTEAAVVLDRQQTPIGSLLAGKRYRATQISEEWVTVLSPNGSEGLVPTSAVVIEASPPPAPAELVVTPAPAEPVAAPPTPRPPADPRSAEKAARQTPAKLWLVIFAVLAVFGSVGWLLLSDTFGESESEPVVSANSNSAATEAVNPVGLQIVGSEGLDQLDATRPLYAFDRVWVTSDLADAIMVLDPITRNVLGFFEIDTNPYQAYEVLGKVWVATSGRTISVIDPVTLTLESIDTGSPSVDFAASAGVVWVANFEAGTVTVYDPDSLSVIATVQVGEGPTEVTPVGDEVWIVNRLSNEISVIDAASFTVVDSIPIDVGTVTAVANSEVWLLGENGLSVVDPGSRSVSSVEVPGVDEALWMVAIGDELWFGVGVVVVVFDAPSRTSNKASLGVPAWTRPVADADTVWLATQPGDLVGLDRETLAVVARLPVGAVNDFTGLIALGTPTVAADRIWIVDANDDVVKVIQGRATPGS